MLEFFLSVFFVSATAIVYTEVLTDEGMLLDFWSRFLHNHIKKEWILKPLVDCVYCFGGQLALWYYLIAYWSEYSITQHFAFVISVLITLHIYNKWN